MKESAQPEVADAPRPDRRAMMKDLGLSLLAKSEMFEPSHISVSRIIRNEGLEVRYGETGPSDARTVRAGSKAWICINERQRGSPRARWSGIHELCHFLEHPDCNAIERIHESGPKTGREHQIEREADWLPAEVLMPEPMFMSYCDAERPTLRDIDWIARRFGTSRQATAKRYTRFASSACAVAECRGGRIDRVLRSASFRGAAFGRRELEPTTFGAALSRGEPVPSGPRRVAPGTWGIEKVGVEMTEHATLVVESGVVLVWLWHAAR